jgi:hypothetical protein
MSIEDKLTDSGTPVEFLNEIQSATLIDNGLIRRLLGARGKHFTKIIFRWRLSKAINDQIKKAKT